MSFNGKVILLTGVSPGIAAATAVRFATLKASLTLVGRNEENVKKIASDCTSSGSPAVLSIVADVSKQSDVDRIVKETIEKFGKIDVLVNNVGFIEIGSIENTSVAQFERIFNANVKSVYQLTMLAVPYLIKTKGNIVNVSSVAGTRSFPGILSFCMSKAALDQFTKCVALELGPKGIRVNSVNPGVIITEFHKRVGIDESTYEKYLKKCKHTHALERPGNGGEVAAAIEFLASYKASFITGELVHVDGGRHAMCPLGMV